MDITRINEFQAQSGKGAGLRELIGAFVSTIESSPGCLSCKLLVSRTDPDKIVVIETWDSVESHRAATQMIPAKALEEAMNMLAGPPSGDYYGE